VITKNVNNRLKYRANFIRKKENTKKSIPCMGLYTGYYRIIQIEKRETKQKEADDDREAETDYGRYRRALSL
jgi:hypothetical protein